MSEPLKFPVTADLAYRQIAKAIESNEALSDFMRAELAKRIPRILTKLSRTTIQINVPSEFADMTPEQSKAFQRVVDDICQQYANVFMAHLAGAMTKHVALIEDLRKRGVHVKLQDE
ncbi:hypothetical protein [Steroidobacter sp.]|uniref:hypothetical protein n=1 Tax=Steroidobacter sp. TaxID=1978227 RepID=UPI001A452276|nr:hypothetical protein [Steroidobacter sp.]MBL8268058.1 hypothetical protein [Steroidobacter sp.]